MTWRADYFVTCDVCKNTEWMDGRTLKDAAATARKAGWSVSATSATCPTCRGEIKKHADSVVDKVLEGVGISRKTYERIKREDPE
jgi:tRNA U54 and U55 pseudouridine synthase Pus10